jgi:hypothetical protein
LTHGFRFPRRILPRRSPVKKISRIFEKGIDFIEKGVYNVKPYEIVALGGVINAQHQVL